MALTRIKQGMIASGAVVPDNIDPTSAFTFNRINTDYIGVEGSSGLKINTLRANTGTWIAYYNPTSKEMTYGPIGGSTGTLQVFDQTLNTTDKVTFAGVAATTATFGGVNIANLRINNAFTLPTTAGSNGQVLTTNGSTATWSTPSVTGNQAVFTTSSVTFANISATTNLTVSSTATITRLVANGNTFPVGLGSANQYLKTDGAGNLSWATVQTTDLSTVTNQTLMSTSTVTFRTVVVTGGNSTGHGIVGGYGVGGDLWMKPGGNGAIYMNGQLGMFGTIVPMTNFITGGTANLGTNERRWNTLFVKEIRTSINTIYFEDTNEVTTSSFNTSTLSLSTGTLSIDGVPVVDQSVAVGSSPTFSSVAMTTSTVEHIEVSTNFIANSSTVQIYDYTMPTAVATTSGWAMTSDGSGAIEFQPAVLSTNVSLDGGFANSTYTEFDYAIDGGGASA